MNDSIVLFGAGAAGRYALQFIREQGNIDRIAGFADNDVTKHGEYIHGIGTMSPDYMQELWPDAIWVACAISRPAATEIRAQMKAMGVRTEPLWKHIPVHHGVPSYRVRETMAKIAGDADTILTINDQCIFRKNPDYDRQCMLSPKEDIYFPDFITRLDDEHFVDCGAADGDTVRAFMERWEKFRHITAFEPDQENCAKLRALNSPNTEIFPYALGDKDTSVLFSSTGDYSSHIDNNPAPGTVARAWMTTLDGTIGTAPTYIKMDIEGAELEALWGARRLLKEHSPVLAICAYHTSDHLWQIPLLVHAINPEYKCFLRRYAEGAWELVWYFVPPERVQ